MNTPLKPCPHCPDGGDPQQQVGDQFDAWSNHHAVMCMKCGAKTATYPTSDDAAKAWNTRYDRTCEWTYDNFTGLWRSLCSGRSMTALSRPDWCCDCGGRIVVKEDKP